MTKTLTFPGFEARITELIVKDKYIIQIFDEKEGAYLLNNSLLCKYGQKSLLAKRLGN